MIKEGCEQEIRWGHYAIGDEVAGLNKQMVTDYIQYLGNLRCTQLGFELCTRATSASRRACRG